MTDDKELEMLADRIAEKVLRGGMSERHAVSSVNQKLADSEREFNDRTAGPLAEIVRQLQHKTRDIREIAAKLNAHADLVHGHLPEQSNGERVGERVGMSDRPKGLPQLPAIFMELCDMDGAMSDLAIAAGRNSTLA